MTSKTYNIFKRKLFTAFLLIFVLFLVVKAFFVNQNLYINTSKSLPLGVYKLITEISALKKGDIILFCLDENVASDVSKSDILSFGNCPFDLSPIGKTVYASFNDMIKIDDRGIFINGRYIDNTRPYYLPSIKPLMLNTILKDDEYIVISQKNNSFDSRYFGIVKRKDIKGKLIPKMIIPQ